MIAALEAKNYSRARNICDQAILWEPQNPLHHYNLACIEAQTGGARLPYAMSELELAVALGFDDSAHLQADPDLAPLHSHPKFAELVRKIIYNATAGDAIASLPIPASAAKSSPTAGSASAATSATIESGTPAPAAFNEGVPVGLYFMTRYWPATRTLEKAAWYFAPDGTVYQNLETGFASRELAAHAGPNGKATAKGNLLEVTFADGRKVSSDIERDGANFAWDQGIFTAVRAFTDTSELLGIYQNGDAITDGNPAATAKRLELRADGSFTWAGVSFIGATPAAMRLSAGSGVSKGRWELNDYFLTLTDEKGAVLRRIAFPCDDEKTVVKPDQIFFGGWVFKRQP